MKYFLLWVLVNVNRNVKCLVLLIREINIDISAGVIYGALITPEIKFTKSYIPNINLDKIGLVLVESGTSIVLDIDSFFEFYTVFCSYFLKIL